MKLVVRDKKKAMIFTGYMFGVGMYCVVLSSVLFCCINYLNGHDFVWHIHMNLFNEAIIETVAVLLVGICIFYGLYFEIKSLKEK